MPDKEIVKQESVGIVDIAKYAMTPQDLKNQVSLIQQCMKEVMKDGEHYGLIPGCGDKKSLFKSGAEKLSFTFRLNPQYDVEVIDLANQHREYRIICKLIHLVSGKEIAQGVGSCSTMETKYRYREGEKKLTNQLVPPNFWNVWKTDKKAAVNILGGQGKWVGKGEDNKWYIAIKGERIENPDIADCYNTCLKMGKKRAHVDATLTGTAASDLFTQDVEDMQFETAAAKPVDAVVTDIKEPPKKDKPKAQTKHDKPPKSTGEQAPAKQHADAPPPPQEPPEMQRPPTKEDPTEEVQRPSLRDANVNSVFEYLLHTISQLESIAEINKFVSVEKDHINFLRDNNPSFYEQMNQRFKVRLNEVKQQPKKPKPDPEPLKEPHAEEVAQDAHASLDEKKKNFASNPLVRAIMAICFGIIDTDGSPYMNNNQEVYDFVKYAFRVNKINEIPNSAASIWRKKFTNGRNPQELLKIYIAYENMKANSQT